MSVCNMPDEHTRLEIDTATGVLDRVLLVLPMIHFFQSASRPREQVTSHSFSVPQRRQVHRRHGGILVPRILLLAAAVRGGGRSLEAAEQVGEDDGA